VADEPDAVSTGDQEGIKSRIPPRVSLNVCGVGVFDVRPPLRPRCAVREHASDHSFDLRKREFKVGCALAFEMVA